MTEALHPLRVTPEAAIGSQETDFYELPFLKIKMSQSDPTGIITGNSKLMARELCTQVLRDGMLVGSGFLTALYAHWVHKIPEIIQEIKVLEPQRHCIIVEAFLVNILEGYNVSKHYNMILQVLTEYPTVFFKNQGFVRNHLEVMILDSNSDVWINFMKSVLHETPASQHYNIFYYIDGVYREYIDEDRYFGEIQEMLLKIIGMSELDPDAELTLSWELFEAVVNQYVNNLDPELEAEYEQETIHGWVYSNQRVVNKLKAKYSKISGIDAILNQMEQTRETVKKCNVVHSVLIPEILSYL